MDHDDNTPFDDVDFAPVEAETERLPLLTVDEAHGLLRTLLAVAEQGGETAGEAGRWAKEIAARIPLAEC